MTRIACVQLSLVADEASNLNKCLSLIDQAAAEKSDLIVLPEMSNWSGGLVRSPDVIEARPNARFVALGINLAATRDKTIGVQGCDLLASAVPAEYGILADINPRE